ncbi:hypothetical protein V0M98_36445 (plasmid) [Pseudomonas silesiensis]|uniref:hypothetical protein n=1 Tax=Pseudomonas silesiensis TaxID=1853130 RepID=UPI0030CE02B6
MIKHFAYIAAALALAGCGTSQAAEHHATHDPAIDARIETMKALAGASVEVKADIYHSGVKIHTKLQVVNRGETAQFVELKPLSYTILAHPHLASDGQILMNVKIQWQRPKGLDTAQPNHEVNQYYTVAGGESGKVGTPMDFKIDDIPVTLVITATKLERTGQAK